MRRYPLSAGPRPPCQSGRGWNVGTFVRTLLTVVVLAIPELASAQGDGPRQLPLAPEGINVFVPMGMFMSGNFNPQQTVLIPGADVDVLAVPLTYMRTFSLGERLARLYVTVPLASLDASAEIFDPVAGRSLVPERRRSGSMDPMVTLHVGLVGAPALRLPEFVKHKKGFQLYSILGTTIPVGTYDPDRLINLGTNRWSFRLGTGTVTPIGGSGRTTWESANSIFLFTDNTDLLLADSRSANPLFVSENHLTHDFTPRIWGSVDIRYQVGGETTTDDMPDDNLTNILGGGVSVGYHFTPKVEGYGSYGRILAKKGDAQEWLVRYQLRFTF